MTFPLEVKNDFDHSEALDAHIARRLERALDAYAAYIQRLELRLSDANGPRHGAGDKVAAIGVTMRPSGRVLVARAGADDIYESVTMVARRARTSVSRYVARLEQRGRQDARPATAPVDAGSERV